MLHIHGKVVSRESADCFTDKQERITILIDEGDSCYNKIRVRNTLHYELDDVVDVEIEIAAGNTARKEAAGNNKVDGAIGQAGAAVSKVMPALALVLILFAGIGAQAQRGPSRIRHRIEHRERTFDWKFVAVSAAPHILNAAYFANYRGCYPRTCVDGSGLTPTHFFVTFEVVHIGMNALGYLAKRTHRKEWPLYAADPTSAIHVYDLTHTRPR